MLKTWFLCDFDKAQAEKTVRRKQVNAQIQDEVGGVEVCDAMRCVLTNCTSGGSSRWVLVVGATRGWHALRAARRAVSGRCSVPEALKFAENC